MGFALFVSVMHMELLRAIDGRVGQGHELIQHSEFKLQLDAIDHGLQCSFDLVVLPVFHGQKDDVHTNDDHVDPDKLHHHLASAPMVDWSQQSYGRKDVDPRDDEFLDTECRHLQTFDNIESTSVPSRIRRIRAICENSRGYVKAECVDNDHSENSSQHFVFPNNQMQP